MLVSAFLERSAERSPEKVALVSDGRRFRYGELNADAQRLAAALRRLGVARGDRVVIHVENGPEAVLALFGTLKAGGVFVPVNPTVKADKLAFILNDSGATVLFTDRPAALVQDTLALAPDVKGVVLVGDRGVPPEAVDRRTIAFGSLLNGSADVPAGSLETGIDLDLAALVYTSGSTGRPKGVALTHLNIVSAAASIHRYLENTEDDVILCVLPLSFDYGLYQVFLAFHASARLVLERSFAYPTLVLDLLARERVTALPIVPMIAALLLRQDFTSYDLSTLRYITNTGAALPPVHIAALRERLAHVRIFSMYGLTECKRVSFLPPEEIDRRPTSVGKPMDNVEVYLLDDEGRRMDAGVGQLVVRGSNVMQGYWNSPEDTARVLKPGPLPSEMVLHSGDTFRIDEDGFMYFQSRTDDVIKSRGQKVSPREIENVLHAVPGVLEAAAVGLPDPVLGQAIAAYVTLDGRRPVTEQEILQYCAKHLEDFMVPREVQIVDHLPRTGTGKVARGPLKAAARN